MIKLYRLALSLSSRCCLKVSGRNNSQIASTACHIHGRAGSPIGQSQARARQKPPSIFAPPRAQSDGAVAHTAYAMDPATYRYHWIARAMSMQFIVDRVAPATWECALAALLTNLMRHDPTQSTPCVNVLSLRN